MSEVANLWHTEIFPWHMAFTAVSVFFNFICQTSVSVLRTCVCVCVCVYIYIYTHTHTHISLYKLYMNYRCYQIVLHVKHFYTNWCGKKCWLDIYHWDTDLAVTFSNITNSSSSYIHIFFLITFFREAFIMNIIIILCINPILIRCNRCRYLFTAKSLYMFRVSIAPIIRSTNCNCSFWYRSYHVSGQRHSASVASKLQLQIDVLLVMGAIDTRNM